MQGPRRHDFLNHAPISSSIHSTLGSVLASLAFTCVASLNAGGQSQAAQTINWRPWSREILSSARAEHKLVLLDLGTSWCHWCHVMDTVTYSDASVVSLIHAKYIAVRVDADARPDLANRYENYGWPATVIFDGDGGELAKRRGYLPPRAMAAMLQAFADDPRPGPSVQSVPAIIAAPAGALSAANRSAAEASFEAAYDSQRGGWGDTHHYLDWNAIEWCLVKGAEGDNAMTRRAEQTLTSGLKLLDTVWGGVFQYSTDGDWEHPHFEKIMPFQAENMRVFALAATLLAGPKWLEPARAIHRYLRDFLTSPDGAFYTSQDADLVDGTVARKYFALNDAERRKLGIPRIDKHIYSRENGLAITGLCALYAATGDEACLVEAKRAAGWVIAHRETRDGGYRHDTEDVAGPFLADTLAMARAFLALYTVTAQRSWLARAELAARFIDAHFRAPVGFATAVAAPGAIFRPAPQVEENIDLARFARLLSSHTGVAPQRAMSEHAMRFLAGPAVVASQGYATGGLLLVDHELAGDPPHVTVVGGKADAAARALFNAALRGLPTSTRLEWLDPAEGALPRSDVELPKLPAPAAYVCGNGTCSAPIQNPKRLSERLAALWRTPAMAAGAPAR